MESHSFSLQEDALTSEDKFFWLDIPSESIKFSNDSNGLSKDDQLGGAYGEVVKFEWMGQQLCAKTLHSVLLETVNKNPKPLQYFRTEVTTWASRLKHTNIVQFLGGWQGSGKIALIMEQLAQDLNKFLSSYVAQNFGVPTVLKRSILRDISSAMMYVHSYDIFHRDLTSKNVLLTSTFVAKVSDFGVAKFYEKSTGNTLIPGNKHFLPPEALDNDGPGKETATYDKSIDRFSFGCIGLHVLTLVDWPVPAHAGDLDDKGNQVYTPYERRWEYFRILSENKEEEDEFLPIIKPCLDVQSEKRPTFATIHSHLSGKPLMTEKRAELLDEWLKSLGSKSSPMPEVSTRFNVW
jgi:serine/threonine protein kinase